MGAEQDEQQESRDRPQGGSRFQGQFGERLERVGPVRILRSFIVRERLVAQFSGSPGRVADLGFLSPVCKDVGVARRPSGA